MTDEKEQSIVDAMKASFIYKSDGEMVQLLELTRSIYKILGGNWLIHSMQVGIIKNEIVRRGIKLKNESPISN